MLAYCSLYTFTFFFYVHKCFNADSQICLWTGKGSQLPAAQVMGGARSGWGGLVRWFPEQAPEPFPEIDTIKLGQHILIKPTIWQSYFKNIISLPRISGIWMRRGSPLSRNWRRFLPEEAKSKRGTLVTVACAVNPSTLFFFHFHFVSPGWTSTLITSGML